MDKTYYNLSDYVDKYKLSSNIVSGDFESYVRYPEHNFVYNKLWVSQSQSISCAPVGVYPSSYPIVLKPIVNLYGFSRGFKIIYNEEDYEKNIKDGFFWQPYFKGKHICCDMVLDKSQLVFCSTLRSYPDKEGSFKLHHTTDYIIPKNIINWINKYLYDYRGCLNLEIINGNIIECHLRLNGDFHLYDKTFAKQLSNFYDNKINIINYIIPQIYIYPIFIKKKNKNCKKKLIEKFLKKSKYVNSYQFDDLEANYQHNIVRFLVFHTTNFYEGLKIKNIILSIIN